MERLAAAIEQIDVPDDDAATRARAMLAPVNGVVEAGDLADVAAWIVSVQSPRSPAPFTRPRALTVHTRDVGDASMVRRLAELHDTSMRLVEVSAVSSAPDGIELGLSAIDEEVDAGADLIVIGHLGDRRANVTARALIGLLTSRDASAVTARAADDNDWMALCADIRDTMRAARPAMGEPLELLDRISATDVAVVVGMLIGAAARRTPMVVDGLVPIAAALVAQRLSYKARRWQACTPSDDSAHAIALDRIEPLSLPAPRLCVGDGSGGVLTLPILQSAAAILRD